MVLICISLLISDFDHLFMYHFCILYTSVYVCTICWYFCALFREKLFKSFAHLKKTELYISLLQGSSCFLLVLYNQYQIYNLLLFSHSVGSFAQYSLFPLLSVDFLVMLLLSVLLVQYLKIHSSCHCHELYPDFFSSFIFSGVVFKSLIHLS